MTTFRKNDADKPQWSGLVRLPGRDALLRTIWRNDHGAAQYGRDNWRNVPDPARYKDALLRHAFALCDDVITDEPTQWGDICHDDAVVWNALALSELLRHGE